MKIEDLSKPYQVPGIEKLKSEKWNIKISTLDNEVADIILSGQQDPYFIMVSATWCKPCKAMKIMLEKGSSEGRRVNIAYFQRPSPCKSSKLKSLGFTKDLCLFPQLWVYKQGVKVDQLNGFNPDKIREFIEKYLKDGSS